MNEDKIFENAISIFNQQTGLNVTYIRQNTIGQYRTDALIRLPNTPIRLLAQCKKWVNNTHAGTLLRQIDQLKNRATGDDILLITDYINPKLAEKLKTAKIQFMDTAGNAYINLSPNYIDIQGKKLTSTITQLKTGKAFQPKGLLIIYALLTQQELIKQPYRKIAEVAGVALGTVKQVIDDLIAHHYILRLSNNEREITNQNQLLEDWTAAYPYNLKNKQHAEVFTTDDPHWYQNLDLALFQAVWGGETAAEKYLNFLTPKDALIYIDKTDKTKFLNAARLRKLAANENPKIRIELSEPFMALDYMTGEIKELAHPLLVYANLLATADPRNIETAGRIYDKYLA